MTTTAPSDMGLSLWLVPSPDERDRLQLVLDRLAKDANGPAFQAHITLVSVPNTTPLPFPSLNLDKFNPMALKCLQVQAGQTYFQSVLIAVDLSPELRSLHDSVRDALNRPLPSGSSYFPHFSLFYGGETQEFKESLVQQLYQDGTAVAADGDTGVAVAGVSEIHVQEVWLLRTEGPPEEWEILGKWRLGPDGDQSVN
ncbi:CPDase domain-containing protein [Ceratobasidium sp. AG-Ba]|nr:CPDase domain-containing protein [Ceratobasidium sp. AG-Ba]